MPTAALRKSWGKIIKLLRQAKKNIPMKAFISGIIMLVNAGSGPLAAYRFVSATKWAHHAPTPMRGTFGNGGTSAHQPSESSNSSSTHNFRGGDRECYNVNKRSVSADARAFTPNYRLAVDSRSI